MAYTDNYFDNLVVAILSLAIFMKSWCMGCGKADELQGQMFRCSSCVFIIEDKCVVKEYVRKYLEYKPEWFGCVSSCV